MKLTRPLVVLDLETTGVWIEKDKIIEIAMIKILPDKTKESFHMKINPGMPIPDRISDLIGITNEDVAQAPIFADIAKDVIEFIKGADFAGFNIERFDLPLLRREMNDASIQFDWQDSKVYDAQKVYHLNEKRDLTAAFQFYCQKNLEGAHSAMVDTQATLEIIESQIQ
ncbi:MAG: 3'-5' exonuclease, partial [Candidatus Omnitrophica bacterium]|nr:3'-5' exonuclease [Candidatus Omnitrophota bacterium]